MSNKEVFDASIHKGIAMGSCVMIENDEMVYAGPLMTAPEASGRMLLLHPIDFVRLTNHLDERRH